MGASLPRAIAVGVVAVFIGALVLLSGQRADAPSFPALTGRVVDEADILSPDTQARLTAMSQALEDKTHDQLVVVTLKSLRGYEIEQYGYQLGRAWAIGQKGRNNGVLLIIAPGERAARIEVGYGLEGTLTDAQSKLIIENLALPHFRSGDYDGGALAASATILKVLGVETSDVSKVLSPPLAEPVRDSDEVGGIPIIFIVIVIWIVFGRFMWPLFFLGGRGGRWGGGGFSGGNFGGGGFSGGGGSFGGGGASGRW